jgi:hypothetical protein
MRRDAVVQSLVSALGIAKASPYWDKRMCEGCDAVVEFVADSLRLENDQRILRARDALKEKIGATNG